MKSSYMRRNAYTVLVSGILFNLTVQVLYVWSLVKDEMKSSVEQGGWGWSSQEAGLPYTFAIIFFALGVLIGGRVQDKTGPRIVASIGGAMVGAGLILSGFAGNDPIGITIGYGVITGLGIGFGYGSILPSCLKWFHPGKKGLIGGLVLGGFGLASVHYAFITEALLVSAGIQKTLLFIGIAVTVLSVASAQFIKNPPPDYVPGVLKDFKLSLTPQKNTIDFTWYEMLKTRCFYLIFILFLFSSSIGLMIIGNLTRIAGIRADVTSAAFLISLVAVMNALGRIIGGYSSDKIGRENTLFIAIVLQMFNMIGFVFYTNIVVLTFGFILTGLCFGTFLAVFPALTGDLYGLKNYGVNYGIVYLAYGFAGVAAPVTADYFYVIHGDFNIAYIICSVLMLLMIGINLLLKKEKQKK